MRFAKDNEQAENHLGRWLTPTIVDWHTMESITLSNQDLRKLLNEHDFGHANCSFNDDNFPGKVSHSPPEGYPSRNEWKVAAETQ